MLLTISEMFSQAISIMGAGIGAVFVVLALFFFLIVILTKIFPDKGKNKK